MAAVRLWTVLLGFTLTQRSLASDSSAATSRVLGGPASIGCFDDEAHLGLVQRNFKAKYPPVKAAKNSNASLQSLLQSNLTTYSVSATMDGEDGSIIFYGMTFMLIIYVLIANCFNTTKDDVEETLAERLRSTITTRWPRPTAGICEEALPAISSAVLGQTKDVPLLLPVNGLEGRAKQQETASSDLPSSLAWSFPISGNSGEPLFTAQQKRFEDGSLGPIEIVDRIGSKSRSLATIDRSLTIFDSKGFECGSLVSKKSGAFELQEVPSGRHRWLITATKDEQGHACFIVTWRPKRVVLATVRRGQHSHAGYLKVMNSPGVDALLVAICVLGLTVFVLDDQKEIENLRGAKANGFASNLLERLMA
jgi:hypothetical protein